MGKCQLTVSRKENIVAGGTIVHECGPNYLVVVDRDGSGPGESGYSSKPAPFGPGMDYTYWTVDVYGDTRINPRGDGGGDGLTLTPAPYPPRPAPSLLPVK